MYKSEKYGINLILGNSVDVMNSLDPESIDLVVCDPPYLCTPRGCGSKMGGFIKESNSLKGKGGFEYNNTMIEEFLTPLYRVMKDGAQGYIMINDKNLRDYLEKIEGAGFHIYKTLIWMKNTVITNMYYMNQHEYIIFFRKGFATKINNCGTKSIIQADNPRNKLHPSQKPLSLIQVLIENSSKEGDVVLDFATGSCSTGIACIDTKRRFVGIEIDPKFFKISKDRIDEKILSIERNPTLF